MKLPEYLLLSGIILLLFLHFCDNRNGDTNETVHYDTVYVKSKDTKHTLTTKEYYPVYKEIPGTPGATVTVPADVDTAFIIKDYNTKNHYADSAWNDSVRVYFSAYTYKNELKDLKLAYRITTPERVVIKTNVVEKQLVFIGVDVCSNGSNLGVYPSLYFDIRRGMIGAGYDPFNKSFKVGLYGKIRLWNKKR